MTRILRSLVVVAACSALSGELAAQELRGTVRMEGVDAPVAGVIIEATDPTTRARVATTLTDARGYFILKLPAPATIALRGLRIGHRPTSFGTFTLAADEVRIERFSLSGGIVALERVHVIGRTVCGRRRAGDLQVFTLLEEARKAILSTQLRSAEGELSAIWTLHTQTHSLRGQPIGDPVVRLHRSSTDRPFRSIPPDSLAKVGYFEAVDDGYVFYAPDADVLLSEAFVEEHCFQATPWTRDDRDWVGIGFRPAGSRRGIVGIQGTLWIDRLSAELQSLEYDYVNLPSFLRTSFAGGEVGFLRLETGAWLVSHWEIRMPRLEYHQVASGLRSRPRLRSLEVTGGDVREVRLADRVLFANEGAEVPAVFRRATEIAELCSERPGPREGLLWGVVRDPDGHPVADARVEVEWDQDYRWVAEWQRTWETRTMQATTTADGFWITCGVPLENALRATAALGATVGPRSVVVVSAADRGLEVDLTLGEPHAARATAIVRGVVFDSLRTGRPWAGAEVRVVGSSLSATSDASGQFELRDVPTGPRTLTLIDGSLAFLRVTPVTASVSVRATEGTSGVVLATPSVPTMFGELCGRAMEVGEGVLLGEVRDLVGARRAGVGVRAEWARVIVAAGVAERDVRRVEATTTADGSFTLCGLPLDGSIEGGSGGAAVHISGEFSLRAEGAGLASGQVTGTLAGVGIVRRDLVVGPARQRTRLGGRVLDPLGQPIADATVIVVGEDGLSTRTATDGSWVLDSVPVRSTEVLIQALRFLPERRAVDPTGISMSVGEIRLQRIP